MQITISITTIVRDRDSFEETFYLTHQGCGRAMWRILVLCGMGQLGKALFREKHRERPIIMSNCINSMLKLVL